MDRILIIDDDRELFSLLSEYLKDEGFDSAYAATPEEGLKMAAAGAFDALILDVMLPGMNGFEVLRRLRSEKKNRALPVIMLTARGEEIDRVVGLELGADDYLGKPFSPRELVARLRALLRRSRQLPRQDDTGAETPLHIDELLINKGALTVQIHDRIQGLTAQEMRLLGLLVQNIGNIVSRDLLYESLFGHQAYPMDRSLDMLVSRLRRKIGGRADGSERIRAVRGEGYIYLMPGDPRHEPA